jgi:hypothetical protein
MIVIYGPPGTGKTRNAERFRQHYRCARVLDLEGHLAAKGNMKPQRGDLVLFTGTQQQVEPHAHQFPRARYVPIWDALREIGA